MIYGENYTLQQRDVFLVYGAATTGGTIYSNLVKNGFRVAAFLDQRAYEIDNYHGLPVLDIEKGVELTGQADMIVVIAIKNVFEHEKIAVRLLNIGFHRVLFRPYCVICGKGTENDIALDRAYDKLFYQKEDIKGIVFPTILQNERPILKDCAILSDEGEYVMANIPLPYVFTDNKEPKNKWIDIPCLGLLPHIGLFETFNGNLNKNYSAYIEFCHEAAERKGGIVTSKAWERSVYQNRMDVFLHMQYSWEHDPAFFVRNAVKGIYNSKGYFNIVSGKHRIIYLLIKGRRYIPLRIKKEDYLLWQDRAQAERILTFIEKRGIDSLPLILRNPYFYDYASDSTVFYEKILHILISQAFQLQYDLGEAFDFSGKKVLFRNTPLALYADVFLILGFSVQVIEEDEVQRQLLAAVLPDIDVCSSAVLEGASENYYIAVFHEERFSQKINAQISVSISKTGQGRQEIVSGISKGELLHAGLNIAHNEKG